MAKYANKKGFVMACVPFPVIAVSFFLVEVFSFLFLQPDQAPVNRNQLWPLAFGGLWSVILSGVVRQFSWKIGRIVYGAVYFLLFAYAVGQTGYYYLFQEMMWISDFRYAAEGTDYLDVLLSYPLRWYLWIVGLAVLGWITLWKFPRWDSYAYAGILALTACLVCSILVYHMPQKVFQQDEDIQYSGTDFGRAKSIQAAYEEMFNAHRLYEVCGLYQMVAKDIYANMIYPLTPGFVTAQRQNWSEIKTYFANDLDSTASNEMTGILADKNVVLVLMESMDDWMIGSFTPTLSKLMQEGIHFSNFYTPPYGGIRTFNTEFCINTGSFLSSQGGYAFDYVTNHFNQSLAHQLRERGYSAKLFHYNDPGFYSRDVFSKALGYEEYVCYADYLGDIDEEAAKELLYDDCLLFDNSGLNGEFFREGKKLNFVITRSAHLSYQYNEVLSHWGLKKYPAIRGFTWNEETDCALLKARLVDDMFARLMEELERHGELENTVIIGVTDHYTYGYKDTENLLMLSGISEELLLEKTPFFVWSSDLESREVEKLLNTSDFLPTVLNLLGIKPGFDYIGHDAFDPNYMGFVPFSDGSWIYDGHAYDSGKEKLFAIDQKNVFMPQQMQNQISEQVQQFVQINNLILETDYYQ